MLVLLFIIASQLSFSQIPWVQKVGGGGLGNPFCVNPLNENIIYSATGNNILRVSHDKGITWQNLSTIPGGSQIKSVAVSAADTNVILVAVEAGPPDKILKTTNYGVSWSVTLSKNFYYWGIPIAHLPFVQDSVVYTMGNDTIYRSTNFGTTWDAVKGDPFGTSNQGWEYCVIRSDSPNVLIVADNASGIWKSYNSGTTWKQVHVATGEVPALAYSPDEPKTIYATRWSGGGGFIKSTDGGETWNYSAQLNGINMWGVAVSTKNPRFLITGTYGPSYATTGGIYISRDGASTWERTYTGLVAATNYGCLVLDTLNLLVLQGDGLWRYNHPTGSVSLTSPNGGEIWHSKSSYSITWTSSGISNIKLEYSLDNGTSWNLIQESIPASSGSYSWVVPDTTSAAALVKISDAVNSSISDQSDAKFIIDEVYITLLSPSGGEEWTAGSTHAIQWNSVGVLNVKIQFSTDNGSNWLELVSSKHASVGSHAWKIPHAPSPACKVKVTSITESEVFGMNESAFTIVDTVQFLATIMLSDNGSNFDTLQFGEKTLATDGLDPLFGEAELSLKPPPGTFDARWNITGTNGTKLDLRDTLSEAHPTVIYTLDMQPGPSGYPITLRWNPETFPPDYFTLRDEETGGEALNMDMLMESTYVINDPSITRVQLVHSLLMAMPVHVNDKWNIVSLPLSSDNRLKSTIFPGAISSAFEYAGKYHSRDTLEQGKGYWLKFNGSQTMLLSGRQRTSDTVEVAAGWNMVGSITKPVPVSSLIVTPPGIFVSSFYSYGNGYNIADTLKPGYGYWMKVSQSGNLTFPEHALKRKK